MDGMSERIEHIREKLGEFDSLAERFVYESYPHDVSCLLERIDELGLRTATLEASVEAHKKRKADLERRNRSHLERIDELKQENEKLAQGKRDAEAYARLMLGH